MVFCNMIYRLPRSNHKRHNPYFNRWFSAIFPCTAYPFSNKSHNPYFNRWFSAMQFVTRFQAIKEMSQSLF